MPFGYELLQFFGGQEASLQNPGLKRPPLVEGLPLAVEVAVVVFAKHAVRTHLARKQSAGEGYSGEDADVAFFGEREELLCRLLAEDVEDYLDGHDARIIEGHPRFFDLLDTYAVVAHFPCFLQPVQRLEGRVLTVDFRRRAMELQQVQGFDPEVLQATLGEVREVIVVVSFRSVGIQAPSCLGRDQDLIVWTVLQEPADELLAASVAVDIRGVEEVHAEVDRPVQRAESVILTDGTPAVPEGPGAETDLRDAHPRPSEVSIFQDPVLSRYSLFQSIALDDLRVPAGARLGDAPLRSIFHEHDPEPLGIPFGPLEVIQQRPDHVTAQVDALRH